MAMARIRLDRQLEGRTDSWRDYRLVLDGTVVGRLGRGERLELETEAGSHELHLILDYCRSRSVELNLTEGEEVRLRCRPNANSFSLLYWLMFRRSDYMSLEIVDPNHVA
jgi:hypothetical protein